MKLTVSFFFKFIKLWSIIFQKLIFIGFDSFLLSYICKSPRWWKISTWIIRYWKVNIHLYWIFHGFSILKFNDWSFDFRYNPGNDGKYVHVGDGDRGKNYNLDSRYKSNNDGRYYENNGRYRSDNSGIYRFIN